MKHEIIKTDNYLLVVDESEIKGWYYDAYINKVKHSGGAEYGESIITRNIIAHLPLNGSPILEGVDLLPPLGDEVEKMAFEKFSNENPTTFATRAIWVDGYNQAKEKYNADLHGILSDFYVFATNGEVCNHKIIDEFIQSLSQPKIPIGFECVMEKDFRYNDDGEPFGFKVHNSDKITTTTTPEGHTQWVGTYIY